jgi:hypothetical protein
MRKDTEIKEIRSLKWALTRQSKMISQLRSDMEDKYGD